MEIKKSKWPNMRFHGVSRYIDFPFWRVDLFVYPDKDARHLESYSGHSMDFFRCGAVMVFSIDVSSLAIR